LNKNHKLRNKKT